VHVLLDGVFNHVGRSFPAVTDVLAHGEQSSFASWVRRDATGGLATFEGHDRLVALNHDTPAVVDHVAEVMTYWLDRGVSGWRLDAAYAVPIPFWAAVTERVRVRHPHAWLVGEVIHGDYAAYVTGGGLDAVTQYELWKAVWSSLNDANLFELAWALDRHNALLDTCAPLTFLGNHDVTRIASRLEDSAHLQVALVLLLTLGGVPTVYAGDEQALRGIKQDRPGGDDAVRPAFPDTPAGLDPEGWDHYRLHQHLIGLRRRHPWLVRARSTVASLTNTAVAYTTAPADGPGRLAVGLNLAGQAVRLPLPDGAWRLAAGAGTFHRDHVGLPAHGWAVASEDTPPDAARPR